MMDLNPEEIYDLTLEEIAGRITPKDKEHLYRVIAENKEAFSLWQELHRTIGSKELLEARESMLRHPPQAIIDASKKQRRISVLKIAGIAATILLAVGSWYLFFSTGSKHHTDDMAIAASFNKQHPQLQLEDGRIIDLSDNRPNIQLAGVTITNIDKTLRFTTHNKQLTGRSTLYVPAGMDYKIELTDGTSIHVNAASRVSFPIQFSGSSREIAINGEAYLEVAQDPHRPFIVKLPDNNQVNVLGTAFNVNTYDTGVVRVALVKGSVQVQSGKYNTILKPMVAAVSAPGEPLQTYPFNEQAVLSWRKGIYEFRGAATLRDVFHILPRWYGVDVVVDDTAILQKQFSGSMDRTQPLSVFLEDLRAIDNTIQTYFDEKGILHLK